MARRSRARGEEVSHRTFHHICFRGLVVAVTGLFGAGCASSSLRNHHGAGAAAPSAKVQAGANGPAAKLASAHAHYAAGVIHDMNEEPEAALQEYHQAALDDPNDEALVLEVSRRFLQAKQPEKALEVLNRASAGPNASGEVFARLGMVYSQLGKTNEAMAANRAAINKSPDLLAGYQSLFLGYLQAKRPQEALKVLDEAAKQPRTDAEYLLALSQLYAALSVQVPAQKEIARAKAIAVLNRAEKLDPEAAPLRLQLAEGFNALGEYTKAARLYLDLLKKMPDIPLIRERVHARLTDIYLRGQDHRRAVEQLEAIIREDPTNPQAYYFLGSLAYESNKLSEAVDYFSKTILLNKEFEQAYYDLAVAQIGLNQSSQALATLEKARQQFPQNFVLEFWTGMAFSRQKDYTQAIQHYTAAEVIARATEPKRLNKEFYFQLGAACERKGDLEQAEKYFQKCLEFAPNFAEALNYLGYMWAEHGTRLDKARDFIEKAVKLEPKNAAYLDSLGWVLYKLSKPAEALDYIVKAAQLSEQPDATVYDHLGDVYAALHQRSKAREAWQKSFSLEANDAVLKKLDGPAEK